jgi:hypothetical protein
MRSSFPPLLAALTLLVGCTGSASDSQADSEAAPAPGPGTLVLSFQMEADLIPSMEVPPVGIFEGSIFVEDDCTAMGPNDGAVAIEDVSTALDLSVDGGPSEPLYTTQAMDAQVVWVVGCLDVDANGCGDPDDPITIPNDNKVAVLADAATPFIVQMNMLRP